MRFGTRAGLTAIERALRGSTRMQDRKQNIAFLACFSNPLTLLSISDDGNTCSVSGLDNTVAIEEQTFTGVDGQACGAGLSHYFQSS
jgi:hypothetical protein